MSRNAIISYFLPFFHRLSFSGKNLNFLCYNTLSTLDFPAVLKIYLERISVADITFGYDERGAMKGLCRAERLLFITTRGGYYSGTDTAWMEMGARHLEALCAMYGIPKFECLCAEGLDDVRNDKEALLAEAEDRARALAEVFG